MTLAEITETDPFELDLLNRHIDPEALNMLLSGNRPETANGTREVTFEYEDHTVTATSSGALTIRPRGEEKTP